MVWKFPARILSARMCTIFAHSWHMKRKCDKSGIGCKITFKYHIKFSLPLIISLSQFSDAEILTLFKLLASLSQAILFSTRPISIVKYKMLFNNELSPNTYYKHIESQGWHSGILSGTHKVSTIKNRWVINYTTLGSSRSKSRTGMEHYAWPTQRRSDLENRRARPLSRIQKGKNECVWDKASLRYIGGIAFLPT